VATATLGPVRASANDEVPYAALTWSPLAALTGGERVWVDLTAAPTAAARMSLVAGDRIGSTGAASLQVNLASDSTVSMGLGSTASIGVRAETAGSY